MSNSPSDVAKGDTILKRPWGWGVLVALLVSAPLVALILGLWLYIAQFGPDLSPTHQRWGEFGDFVGGFVGTILATATLIALACTLWLQARALQDTREALSDQQRSAQEQLTAAQSLYAAAQEANTLTRDTMQQSLALERARNRPHVIFTIDFESEQRRHDTITHAYARVRNIGATAAHNVIVTTTPVLRGRLGIDSEPRQPAVLGTTIAFMPPKYEMQDILAYAPFLFEDNKDEELRFTIQLDYADDSGERYRENYSIDLAAQKHALTNVDATQMTLIKLSEQMERAARSLDTIARVLDSPDRSGFMQPLLGEPRLSSAQQQLLHDLVALARQTESPSFLAAQYVGDHRAVIKSLGKEIVGEQRRQELKAPIEDVEYLCRAGALHGAYRHGALMFALTVAAERFLNDAPKVASGSDQPEPM